MACYDKKGANGPFYGKRHSEEQIKKWLSNPNRSVFKTGPTNPNTKRFGAMSQKAWNVKCRLLETINACERCGYGEHPGILQLHHIDRNRKNNDRSNVVILCPNCHTVEHYLARDGGFSRLKL
jgi:hypothetical protein